VDLQELQIYVDQATIDGVFHMDKFSEILNTLEESERLVGPVAEEKDILAIVEAMQEARASEELDPEAVERGLSKVGDILAVEEEPEPEL
jgi:hypothetical protein